MDMTSGTYATTCSDDRPANTTEELRLDLLVEFDKHWFIHEVSPCAIRIRLIPSPLRTWANTHRLSHPTLFAVLPLPRAPGEPSSTPNPCHLHTRCFTDQVGRTRQHPTSARDDKLRPSPSRTSPESRNMRGGVHAMHTQVAFLIVRTTPSRDAMRVGRCSTIPPLGRQALP
jgi:hypothetical protein